MPKIAEMKEIDGALWACLDVDFGFADQPVHLLTQSEIDRLVADERERCAKIAENNGCGNPGCTECVGGAIAAELRAAT